MGKVGIYAAESSIYSVCHDRKKGLFTGITACGIIIIACSTKPWRSRGKSSHKIRINERDYYDEKTKKCRASHTYDSIACV
jgi:hypothetical protein